MNAAIALLVFAQDTGPRNDSPDEGLGIGIILGIVVLVVLALAALWFLFGVYDRRRREKVGDPEESHPPGRVGRL